MSSPTQIGPRERLAQLGAEALGNAELLAVLLGTGTRGISAVALAAQTLKDTGGLRPLATATVAELMAAPGLGPAKAARIAAAAEFGRRISAIHPVRGEELRTSRDAHHLLAPRLSIAEVELFIALPLDARNRPMGELLLAKGGLTQCAIAPCDAFRPLLRMGAAGVIFAHNHPSGRPEPSVEDIMLTQRLCAAGELLGIPVLDHLVIGHEGYMSFADRGLLGSSDSV